MPQNEDEYKEWQDRYEDLREEWDDDWSDEQKRDHLENMQLAHEQELRGREEAQEEWGDDGNDGHDERIEALRGRDQLLKHGIAHAEGEYEYQTEGMQDMDENLREELETENNERWRGSHEHAEGDHHEEQVDAQEDNSDMDIESDSD